MEMTQLFGCGKEHLRKSLEVKLKGDLNIPNVVTSAWLSDYSTENGYGLIEEYHLVYLVPAGLPALKSYSCETWRPCGVDRFTRVCP